MSTRRRLGPYFFVRARTFREDRIRAYIVGQHRRGRTLEEILADPCTSRLGSQTLIWSVVCQPETIAALEDDVVRDIEGRLPARSFAFLANRDQGEQPITQPGQSLG
jgi:hypothetical protein